MMALEFWFEFASTYSYPATMRIEAACRARSVPLLWKPFLLGPIFAAQGWRDSPFNLYPAKGRYMWRDLERLCARDGLALRRPSVFPRNGLLAARIATLSAAEPWIGAFVRAVYQANFGEDREISESAVIAGILEALGLPAAALIRDAASTAAKDRLRAATEDARERGIFGAPSFVVGGELFWGNDRLDQALDWASATTNG
jgi:2-hydroxychromene-2-carboxylate isomerase